MNLIPSKKDSTDLDLIPDIGIEGLGVDIFGEICSHLYGPVVGYVNNYIVSSDVSSHPLVGPGLAWWRMDCAREGISRELLRRSRR